MKRYKNIVGKEIGNKIYVHKRYAPEIIPGRILFPADMSVCGFDYNCIVWDKKSDILRFDEASDFDTAREPHVGKYIYVYSGLCEEGKSNSIWHHKWMWVKDDYGGFDVEQSKKWSQMWHARFKEVAKGTDKSFNAQLKKYGLGKYLEQTTY